MFNINNRFIYLFQNKGGSYAPVFISFGGFMNEPMIELARKMTEKLEKFLKACKEAGDVTIDDVLKRLEELTKET